MRFVNSLLFFQIASATASITCLEIGTRATATWVNAQKQSCAWVGEVGSNFGFNPVNNGR